MCVYSLYIELHVYVPVVAVLQSLLLNCEALEFALDLKTMLHLTAVRVSNIMIVLGPFWSLLSLPTSCLLHKTRASLHMGKTFILCYRL